MKTRVFVNILDRKVAKNPFSERKNSPTIFCCMRPRFDSGETNTLSEETIDRPNLAIVPLSLLGMEGNGRNIDFFTELAYKN